MRRANWPEIPIQTVMSEFHDGPHATPKVSDTGPVFLGIKNITPDGHLNLNEIRHIAEADFPKWTRKVEPMAGDIVFTYEATLHRYAIIPPGFRGCLGRRLALIRPDSSMVDTRFLHYYLLSPVWKQTVLSRINIGSTVDRIPLVEFPQFPVALPPLDTQRKIASVLSAYDDLIVNNTRRIAILEDMARTIYREWFIEFRYPGHEAVPLVESELGPIPEGWSVATAGTLVTNERVGVDPATVAADTAHVGLEHIPKRSFTLTDQGVATDVASRKWTFRQGDVLFGKLRPYFHKVVVAPGSGICSTDILVLRPATEAASFAALTVGSDDSVAHASGTATGTDRPRADWFAMEKRPVAIPSTHLLGMFEEVVGPMLLLPQILVGQNTVLKAARDLLLPRLVSGDVDVSDLDIDLGVVA